MKPLVYYVHIIDHNIIINGRVNSAIAAAAVASTLFRTYPITVYIYWVIVI